MVSVTSHFRAFVIKDKHYLRSGWRLATHKQAHVITDLNLSNSSQFAALVFSNQDAYQVYNDCPYSNPESVRNVFRKPQYIFIYAT